MTHDVLGTEIVPPFPITTEIAPAGQFWDAEPYHQQYPAKHPNGYCGLGETGVACPVGIAAAE